MNLSLPHFLRNLRIQRKLVLVILLTCVTVLLLACAGMFGFQIYHLRRELERDLKATAEIIAANSEGPLLFMDKKQAADTLASLKAKPHIVYASTELKDRTLFAQWGVKDSRRPWPASAEPDVVSSDGWRFAITHPIRSEGQLQGTLTLDAEGRGLFRDLCRLYAQITGGVLLISMFVAFLLSTRMQRLISEPILALARFAKVVAEQKDYSVRAQRVGQDEVGTLTDAFNTMLGRIHEDAASLRSINHNLKCEITERERTEAALRSSELRFRSVTQSASDAIVSTDTRGRIIFWNKGAERIFGFEEGEILGESVFHLLREPWRKSYQEHVERVQADGSAGGAGRTIEMEGVKKKGEAFPFELSLSSWRAGEEIFFSSIIRDITERKRAEAELAALNKQLQDTSRQAGMAEVATAVLHNVGNVLNSVNVSATLIGDRIHASKVTSVTRVASLLQEPGRDVATFLTTDPRGQKVPGYLAMLAQQLQTEQAELLQEVASLRKNVDHIKEIVAMQQSYAKVSGVVEDLAAAELLEDALRMDAAGLARQDIRIVRDYAEVPTVAVDRHKAVQILVNLIRNARQALSESPSFDRTLTLRIAPAGSDRVRLEITDTGVGIAPENLTNIFRHGFTTKKNGHGFGLHSGANAAREMGGSLYACSAGIGCGATFSLELPARTARSDAHAA